MRHRKRLTWQNVQKKTFYCINRKITDWPWNDWHQKLFYSIYSNISFDYIMVSGVEQEVGSLNTPMALAHPIHPFRKRSGNKSSITWVGWFVSSWVSRWASCVPFTNFLIEVYFFTIVIILGISTAILFFGTTCLNFRVFLVLQMHTFLYVSAPGFSFKYWITHISFGFLYVMCRSPTGIFYRGDPDYPNKCPCGVWCHGLTSRLLYVGPIFQIKIEIIVDL